MSDEDIDKAVKEAAEFEAQDKKRKEGIDAKNEADAMVFQTEKALQEVGDKLDGADKAAVEADCKALKELLEKANTDTLTDEQVAEIKAGKEKLTESAQKLFTKMYATQAFHQTLGQQELRELVLSQELMQEQARHQKDSRATMS